MEKDFVGTFDNLSAVQQMEAIGRARRVYGPLARELCNCPRCTQAREAAAVQAAQSQEPDRPNLPPAPRPNHDDDPDWAGG